MTAGLLRPAQAAEYLGLSIRALEDWRRTGRGPPWLRLGHRTIRYRQTALDDWLDECEDHRDEVTANPCFPQAKRE